MIASCVCGNKQVIYDPPIRMNCGECGCAWPEPENVAPPAIMCSAWMDALAERFERRASQIYRSTVYGTEEQRQMMTAVFDGIADELRAESRKRIHRGRSTTEYGSENIEREP